MLRFVQVFVGVLVAALAAAGFTLYLSHGPLDTPERATLPGLAGDARIDWFDDARPLRIDAASETDALRALGFALAQEDVWTMLVWRQAARGRLAEWLGPSVLPQDRHVRQLGIARDVDAVAARLDGATLARLTAFCDGINAALATARVRRNANVALLGVALTPWTPGDVVASERLVAWLSASMPASPFPSVALDAVSNADGRLRALLATDALGEARAWSFTDDPSVEPAPTPSGDSTALPADSLAPPAQQRRLVATYVTGQQARPFLRAAEVRIAGQAPRLLLFLPGTPFPLAGARLAADGSATEAWAVLPRASAAWEAVASTAKATMVAERMNVAGGQEAILYAPLVGGTTTLVAQPPPVRRLVRRDTAQTPATTPSSPGAAPVTADSAARGTLADSLPRSVAPDTVVLRPPPGRWRLAWTGESGGSDAAAWLGLWSGQTAPMRLVRLDGLIATAEGTTPFGPSVPHRRGLVAGDTLVRDRLAARLDRLALLPAWPSADAVRDDARAATLTLVRLIDERRLSRPIERTALDILRNWDGSYDANSIGATIFESLTAIERAERGRDAFAAARDSAYFSTLRQTAAFQTAVRRLVDAYGVTPSDWRRGAAMPQTWRVPFWGLPGLDLPAARRYAPLDVPGGGHPLALAYGPTVAQGTSTVYELDLSLTPGVPVRLRRPNVDTDRFLGRYRASLDLPTLSLGDAPLERSTALVPR